MKKTLLLLASAAMLLVGCAKEKFAEPNDGGLTSVTFSASVDGGVATKAAADNDGKGTNVNRCIMEIYFQNQLYKRMEAAMSGTPATVTFANVPVVAGKEYQVLFWADCGGDGQIDKYYTTKTEGVGNNGLKAVTVNKTNFIDALKSKKNDELDAFFFADNYTIPQNQSQPFAVTLKRPFAQLNVITTDINKTVTSAALLPEKVSVSYKADNILNVATGETSRSETEADYTFTYEAPVYGVWSDTKSELTLSMDYILADKEQRLVNVAFSTSTGMSHDLNNLPYQRNYRTNVKGDLLTANGSWTAKIDTIWSNPDIVKVVEVADIKSANKIINQYKETTNHLEVKFTGEPSDSGEPAGEAAGIRAIVTTPIKEGNTLSIEVLTETKKLYIGDYKNEYIVSGEDFIDTDNSKHAVVNVNVPEESSINTLVINAPSKSVYINGKEVANVGTITDLDAITSQNTLIIEKGQTVNKLTIRQGGLEIHGTVTTLEITENAHSTNPVKVRTSENLSQTVFDEIYKEGGDVVSHDYIDRPDFSERQNANGTWDIVPSVCKIEETYYGSLAAAVAAVPTTGVETTITMIDNHAVDVAASGTITIPSNKNIILDLNGKEVAGVCTSGDGSALIKNEGTLKIVDNGATKGIISYGATPSWIYEGELNFTGSYVSNLITNYGTLNISGAYLDNQAEGSACFAIDIYAGNVTVDDGYIKAAKSAVRMFYGTGNFIFNSGTIDAGRFNINSQFSKDSNHHITINGGNILTSDPDRININTWSGASENNTNCSIEINGGTFSGVVSQYRLTNVSVNGGYFYAFCSYVEGNKPIKGGFYESDKFIDGSDEFKLSDYVAEKYDLIENTDEATKAEYPWTVDRKHVAMIGSTKYYTLAEAVAAVPTDGTQTTITMIADHEILGNAGVTVAATQNIILDLAGYIVKNLVNENKASQVISNKGKLKIIDTAGDGLITNAAAEGTQTGEWWSDPQCNYATNVITNNGDLTIDGANLLETANTSICYAIDNNSSGSDVTCTIKSGNISAPATAIRMFCNSTTNENSINVEGGLIEGGYAGIWTQLPGGPTAKKATLNISGGTLKGKYAWYDYPWDRDLYDLVFVTITGGCFDGYAYSYGANIDISGGVFKSNVTIKENESTTATITGGKFDADIFASQTYWRKIISGALFKTYVNTESSYSYWFYEICEGKNAYYLEESHPAYAEGYRYIVR